MLRDSYLVAIASTNLLLLISSRRCAQHITCPVTSPTLNSLFPPYYLIPKKFVFCFLNEYREGTYAPSSNVC